MRKTPRAARVWAEEQFGGIDFNDGRLSKESSAWLRP